MKQILITNNILVKDKYIKLHIVIYLQGGYIDVLTKTRDYIHQGHKLLTHPLSGSIKPNETPFKSILLSNEKSSLDMESLLLIEKSIDTAKKFIQMQKTPKWTETVLDDFREIDCTLIDSGIESQIFSFRYLIINI